MKFEIKKWRRMYDKIHEVGATLNDSRPTYTERGDYIEPLTQLSKDEQNALEKELRFRIRQVRKYLDYCKYRLPTPLWWYDPHDKKTHASSPKFRHEHLVI